MLGQKSMRKEKVEENSRENSELQQQQKKNTTSIVMRNEPSLYLCIKEGGKCVENYNGMEYMIQKTLIYVACTDIVFSF